ncbi:MAG: adenosylmethionine decarboxylase [Flavobacteriaceae bacterium]
MNKALGFQTTIDFYGCNKDKINSRDFIEKTLLTAAKKMNLTVVNTTIHEFSPIGISGVIVIEESHIAIHTWPEHNYVALDFFTCGKTVELSEGISWLTGIFSATKVITSSGKRGDMSMVEKFNTNRK